MSEVNSYQVGGRHYAVAHQHWDFVASHELGYFEGQVTKYVTRWRKKNGIEDLQKALHFLEKLIELADKEAATPVQTCAVSKAVRLPLIPIQEYCLANQLTYEEQRVIVMVTEWRGVAYILENARQLLKSMITAATPDERG